MATLRTVLQTTLRRASTRPATLVGQRGYASKFNKYNWEDPFLLESQLTDEEKMVRDSANAYAQERLLPRVIQATRTEQFDTKIMREMGSMG
ncbi:hypothetical protein H4S03_008121, partial [Coemansia sp. S3946]